MLYLLTYILALIFRSEPWNAHEIANDAEDDLTVSEDDEQEDSKDYCCGKFMFTYSCNVNTNHVYYMIRINRVVNVRFE
jgi:hypothetical protein